MVTRRRNRKKECKLEERFYYKLHAKWVLILKTAAKVNRTNSIRREFLWRAPEATVLKKGSLKKGRLLSHFGRRVISILSTLKLRVSRVKWSLACFSFFLRFQVISTFSGAFSTCLLMFTRRFWFHVERSFLVKMYSSEFVIKRE